MEPSIVTDFQNLHVLANCSFQTMDELVQDLTSALNETTKSAGASGGANENKTSIPRKYNRKRRGKKRRTCLIAQKSGHVSEASESSIDEILKGYYEKVMWQSDSDDVYKHPLPAADLTMVNAQHNVPVLSLPESDSVNENFSPARMHRRKRRPKRMTVDDIATQAATTSGCMKSPGPVYPGKRKRNLTDRVSSVDSSMDAIDCDMQPQRPSSSERLTNHSTAGSADSTSASAANMTNESSSLSSTDSETNCEDRDGDDEHSDFFHESECSVAGIIPWWENARLAQLDNSENSDNKVDAMTQRRTTQHCAKAHYQTRLRYLLGTREIRTAKRKLKAKRTCHSANRCLPPRCIEQPKVTMWSTPTVPTLSGSSQMNSDIKRRRRTPPLPDELSESGNPLLYSANWNTADTNQPITSSVTFPANQPLTTSALANHQPLTTTLNQLQPIGLQQPASLSVQSSMAHLRQSQL